MTWPRVAGVALVALLAACGQSDGSANGAGSTTGDGDAAMPEDPRGWVTGQPGLFGRRRLPGGGSGGTGIGQIGYAPGSEAPSVATGVLVNDAQRAAPGLNLMCSGDEAVAELRRLDGTLVHRWARPYGLLPDAPKPEGPHQLPWRRVHMTADGGLLAIHSGRALVSIDRDSGLRWVRFLRAHHDLAVDTAEEKLFVLARIERTVKAVNPNEPVVDDLIVTFDLEGQQLASLSLWDAFETSSFAPMIDRLTVRTGDVMHTNSIEFLDERAAAAFAVPGVVAGHVLVCMRDLDIVAAVDLDAGKLVWMTQGPAAGTAYGRGWRAPHDPTVTAEGQLLVFDNRGGPAESSRVLALDPNSGDIEWSWPPATSSGPQDFASFFCGTAQELPNGNVLATESCRGRAVEFDPRTGDVVWEYVSDRLAGPNDEFVAALFAVERIPPVAASNGEPR